MGDPPGQDGRSTIGEREGRDEQSDPQSVERPSTRPPYDGRSKVTCPDVSRTEVVDGLEVTEGPETHSPGTERQRVRRRRR